jgi:predicted hydrocarbon binding protein
MFKEERDEFLFDWSMIGDINLGRPNLGANMDVSVYRLMQFTLRDVLITRYDAETADRIFYDAGKQAGIAFCKKMISKKDDFNEFMADLQEQLRKLGVGILRVEKADMEKMNFTLTVSEDLDCSGLPVSEETICTYDEGFISGLLFEFSGKNFIAKEVDCWCSGDRVCRFDVKPE